MNKKLLAIAVGAVMVAGATAATAGDEPTIYGKLHLSIDSMDNGAGTVGGVDQSEDGIFVSSNSSRLGIKGAVDLDGGLKAVYKYEMSTDYSTAGGVSGNRNAYLGLKGGFGQIVAGRHDMPFKTVGRKADLFGDTIGDHRAVTRLGKSNIQDTGDAAGKTVKDDWADRSDDVIMYTNKFGAVALKVVLGQGEKDDKANDTGVGLTYKQGPLNVMFANETHGKGNLSGNKDSVGNIITGAYKMGNMKFIGGYMAISDLDGRDGLDATGYTVAGAMKSGMNTFKLQYTSGELDCTGCTDTVSTLMAIGVDHKLSKKTSVYAVYATIANEDGVQSGFAGTGHAGTVKQHDNDDTSATAYFGDDPSGISIGMVHKF